MHSFPDRICSFFLWPTSSTHQDSCLEKQPAKYTPHRTEQNRPGQRSILESLSESQVFLLVVVILFFPLSLARLLLQNCFSRTNPVFPRARAFVCVCKTDCCFSRAKFFRHSRARKVVARFSFFTLNSVSAFFSGYSSVFV